MPRFTNLTDTDIIKDTYPRINTGFANFETDVNAHFAGSADNHDASDIVNDSTVTGARVDDALDDLQNQIDSISTADSNATIGVYSVTATGTNTLTGSVTGLTYFGGLKINLKIATTNTGAVTFNLNALGAKNLRKLDGAGTKVALEPRDLLAGKVAQLEYDGTHFILVNAKDVATYSAEQTETVEIASLPNTAVEGEVDAVVNGQTVVNLLGTKGDCEDEADFNGTDATLATSTTSANIVTGTKALAITLTSTSGTADLDIFSKLIAGKYYLATGYIKRGNATNIKLSFQSDDQTVDSSTITTTTYTRVGVVVQPTDYDTATGANIRITVTGASANVAQVDAIQFNEITQTEHTAGVTQALLDKYPYINDIAHVEANRVKVVGKNLFDLNSEINIGSTGLNTINNGIISSTGGWFTNVLRGQIIKLKGNTQYTLKVSMKNANDNTLPRLEVESFTSGSDIFVLQQNSTDFTSYTQTFTSPQDGLIILRLGRNGNTSETNPTFFKDVQLEQGSTATTYEPYTETTRYFDKSLKSLPNGTKDTINNGGLYTKRLSDMQNITDTTYASIDTATYTDVDVVKTTAFSAMRATTTGANGFTRVLNKDGVELSEVAQADIDLTTSVGKYYVHTDKTIWFIVADGTYADVTAARTGLGTSKAMFELATPLTEQLRLQPLQSQASGTIYNEPITRELLTYATGLTLTNDLRKASKNFIESLFKVDGETKTRIALTAVTVASATSLTISGATDDEQYEVVYEVEIGNSTRAELTYSYPLDNVAQLDDVSKITFKTSKELRDFINYQNAVNVVFDARITAVEP